VAVVQYTFPHKQYKEQHNNLHYTEYYINNNKNTYMETLIFIILCLVNKSRRKVDNISIKNRKTEGWIGGQTDG
jgi:hypothetical protein